MQSIVMLVSIILCVIYKPCMLCDVMLNFVVLNVVEPISVTS